MVGQQPSRALERRLGQLEIRDESESAEIIEADEMKRVIRRQRRLDWDIRGIHTRGF